jgi:2-polyprenyl-6-methoxyphenol hydroxylase-like FAD-dependent oxidoreductase
LWPATEDAAAETHSMILTDQLAVFCDEEVGSVRRDQRARRAKSAPVVADVVLTGLEREAWHRFHEGSMDRQMSLCPLAGTGLFQLQAPIPLDGDVDLTAEGLSTMVAERTGRDDIRIQSVSWASAFNMNARLADRYRIGRVFLVGDLPTP